MQTYMVIHMSIFGHILNYIKTNKFEGIWSYMIKYNHIWSYMLIYDHIQAHIWSYMFKYKSIFTAKPYFFCSSKLFLIDLARNDPVPSWKFQDMFFRTYSLRIKNLKKIGGYIPLHFPHSKWRPLFRGTPLILFSKFFVVVSVCVLDLT